MGSTCRSRDAPVPLEETGGAATSKDISGQPLPGISKWGASLGGEITFPLHAFGGGQIFGGLDYYHRSEFSSSPTLSKYLWIDGYSIVNVRVGFRASKWSGYLWARKLDSTRTTSSNCSSRAATRVNTRPCSVTRKRTVSPSATPSNRPVQRRGARDDAAAFLHSADPI